VFELALLSSHQRTLANHGSASGAKKFLDEALLADEDEEGTHNFTEERQRSLVNLRCRLVQAIQVSDHHLIVAQVDAVEKGTETSPLVYWLRQYRMVG
jgi:flavin reductase (DIM6/NTAB) family NADH-FMN oxidoreductase RutF